MTDLVAIADAAKLDALIRRAHNAPHGTKLARQAELRRHAHDMLSRECPPKRRSRRKSRGRA